MYIVVIQSKIAEPLGTQYMYRGMIVNEFESLEAASKYAMILTADMGPPVSIYKVEKIEWRTKYEPTT